MYPDAPRCRLCDGYAAVGQAIAVGWNQCSHEPGNRTGYCHTHNVKWRLIAEGGKPNPMDPCGRPGCKAVRAWHEPDPENGHIVTHGFEEPKP